MRMPLVRASQSGESLLQNTYSGLLSLSATRTAMSRVPRVFRQAVMYEAASLEARAPQPPLPQPVVTGTGLGHMEEAS